MANFILGCDSTDVQVGPLVIINPHPVRCMFVYLLEIIKQMLSQPIVANRSVKSFNLGVMLWLA